MTTTTDRLPPENPTLGALADSGQLMRFENPQLGVRMYLGLPADLEGVGATMSALAEADDGWVWKGADRA